MKKSIITFLLSLLLLSNNKAHATMSKSFSFLGGALSAATICYDLFKTHELFVKKTVLEKSKNTEVQAKEIVHQAPESQVKSISQSKKNKNSFASFYLKRLFSGKQKL